MKHYSNEILEIKSSKLKTLLKGYRKQRNFDVHKYLEAKKTVFLEYFKKHDLNTAIVALSGGIDSALVYAMLQWFKSNDSSNTLQNVQGVCLPAKDLNKGATNQKELTKKVKELFDNYNEEYYEFDISNVVNTINDELNTQLKDMPNDDSWAIGQLVSYSRTPIYYYLSSCMYAKGNRSVVVGTTNKDEGAYLGYFGKASDGMVDIQLISDLHKSEVYKVAEYLKVPQSIIYAVPTGDMYDSRTDEEVFGTTYDFVELYLFYLENKEDDIHNFIKDALDEEDLEEFMKLANQVESLHNYNKHKYLGHSPAVHMDVILGTEKIENGWKYFNFISTKKLRDSFSYMKLQSYDIDKIKLQFEEDVEESEVKKYPLEKNDEVNVISNLIPETTRNYLMSMLSNEFWIPVGKHGMKQETIKNISDIGSYRTSLYSQELADIISERLKDVTSNLSDLNLNNRVGEDLKEGFDLEYIGINPLFRFIKYTPTGYLVPHYDLPYENSETNEITLLSLVIYLKNDGTATRFLSDSYGDIPYSLRDLSDFENKLEDESKILAKFSDVKNSLIFDHILLHDSEECKGEKIIIRTDLMFKKTKKVGKKMKENLEVLNKMKVLKISSAFQNVFYFVANTPENMVFISQIVPNHEQVLNEYMSDERYINITKLAFENCGAVDYDFETNSFI